MKKIENNTKNLDSLPFGEGWGGAINSLFPIFLKLDELQTLVVGGGAVGYEKLNALLINSPQANVTLVGEVVNESIRTLQNSYSQVKVFERLFTKEDLRDKDLVIIATDHKEVNATVQMLAKKKKILVNVSDTPDLCDFYLGSVVQKGHLKLGISTNGQSPTMAKRLKEVLNEVIPDTINESIENLHKIRDSLSGNFAYKVQELNRITKLLAPSSSPKVGEHHEI